MIQKYTLRTEFRAAEAFVLFAVNSGSTRCLQAHLQLILAQLHLILVEILDTGKQDIKFEVTLGVV